MHVNPRISVDFCRSCIGCLDHSWKTCSDHHHEFWGFYHSIISSLTYIDHANQWREHRFPSTEVNRILPWVIFLSHCWKILLSSFSLCCITSSTHAIIDFFLIYYCFLKVLYVLGFLGCGRRENRGKENCYELLALVLLPRSMANTIQVSTILPSKLIPCSKWGNAGKCKKNKLV